MSSDKFVSKYYCDTFILRWGHKRWQVVSVGVKRRHTLYTCHWNLSHRHCHWHQTIIQNRWIFASVLLGAKKRCHFCFELLVSVNLYICHTRILSSNKILSWSLCLCVKRCAVVRMIVQYTLTVTHVLPEEGSWHKNLWKWYQKNTLAQRQTLFTHPLV